ncbi:hypothetical protein ATN84_21090 [Paramesorhizobium deserti]|uniref:ZinT domain-containing protein n=1 Tax=Paramesorhizobium deserti TaxID=1494590 RepID=A0A135HPR6_9HYPH|nr:zinc metallochaperone AztD [Paramesorhizobium deserti]KXF75166.1 hypothetical protein ATN84_21090 [Paramesorhizobium deserti]
MRLSLARSPLTAAVAATFVLTAQGALADDDPETKKAWRLFVADHTQPIVRAIDFETGKELGRYDVKGHAALTASASGQTIFATQSEHDMVNVIKSGIEFSDHGDHRDLDVSDVALLPVTLQGPRPSHVVPHGDHAVIFYDRGGKADIIDEAALLEGRTDVRSVDTTKPHHGVAVTMGRHVLVSVPDTQADTPPDKLPPRIGLRVVDKDGKQVGEMAKCTDLHGEATSARLVAFGCKEGVLVARPGGADGPKLEMVPYPTDFPKGYTSTLLGGKAMQFFLGNYGEDNVVLIDPDNESPYRLVELPTRRVDFLLDPATLRNAYILTEDGNLQVLDVIKGEIVRKGKVTEPYSKDGHWRDPRPRLAVADGQIAITDPRHSTVRVIDPETLKEIRTIPVEGQPFSVVAVGGSGADHGHSHDHAHDHDNPVYKGYFDDSQVKERALSDWAGDWQSVYPYLRDGTLDPVMAHKAKQGDQSADEYRAYYEIGYRTNVERIEIKGDTVEFFENGKPLEARYANDGYEILTYKKGNRGVRFIFKKIAGDEAAPQYIQFSDHKIAPEAADHYHLYWGNDRAALLEEVTNWPTYYPSSLSAKEIVREMMAH